MAGAADDGGKHGTRSVVSGEPGLAHAGAIVHNESSNIFVTHLESLLWKLKTNKSHRYKPESKMRVKKSIAIFGVAILLVTCLMLYLSFELARIPVGLDGYKTDIKKNEISDLENRLFRLENDLKKNHKTIDDIMATVKSMLKVDNNAQWKHIYDQLQKTLAMDQNNSECSHAESFSAPVNIQMLNLYDQLPFDNPDGGAWKQGWDITYDKSQWNDQNQLRIFVVPHSHNDPGWIKTIEKYYSDQTQHILNNMAKKLPEDSRRKFIWAEISYMSMWWNKILPETKATVRKLLRDGQLEIVTGGWVMNDEASTHYFAILNQIVEGHEWMSNHLGVKPKNGWAIDPFGLSPTMAYLLKRMNFTSMVIQRVHYAIKKYFSKEKSLEFLWKQAWDQNSSTDMFCHMMPFYSYDIPHTCGPDPKVCCQFDFKRLPGSKVNCPWRIPPQPISTRNVEERASLLLDQYRKKAQLFRTNVLFVPLGDDFRFDKADEWDHQYRNYQLLFDHMNKRTDWHVQAQFGTLNDYYVALLEDYKKKHNDNSLQEFPSVSGDFFTYADRDDHYWSGYFTSRPFYKKMDRILEAYLRAGEIIFSKITALASNSGRYNNDVILYLTTLLVEARRNLGLFQHHDAITGTAKDVVVIDYANKLLTSIQGMQQIITYGAEFLLAGQFPDLGGDTMFTSVDRRTDYDSLPENIIFNMSDNSTRILVVYNSLAQRRQEIVHVFVTTPYICVMDANGNVIPNQVNPQWQGDHIAPRRFQISFLGDIPALGFSMYAVSSVSKDEITDCKITVPSISVFNSDWDTRTYEPFSKIQETIPSEFMISNMHVEAIFNPSGLLRAIKLKNDGLTLNVELQFLKYGVRNGKEKSGAYLFLPDKEARVISFENPVVRIIRGSIMSEVHVFLPNILHTVQLINSPGADGLGIEINNIVDITADVNKEMIMRIITDITPNQHEFFTDLNGFQILKRKTLSKLPTQANYYPMPTLSYIEDNETRFTVFSAQPLGVGSLQPGWIEIMLDRRLNQDDHRGLEQGVLDNKRTPNRFRFLVEKRLGPQTLQRMLNTNGHLSMVGHVAMQSLLHPVFPLISDEKHKISELKFRTYSPVSKDLPCDVHLVNLRTSVLETENMKLLPTNASALFLHRIAHDCGIFHPGYHCVSSAGQVSISDVLSDLYNEKVTKMSLSLLYEEEAMTKSQQLRLEAMEIYAFRLTR